MTKMEIKKYARYDENEILALYADAGWSAYTRNAPALERGFENSLAVLAAYEENRLVGILRAVGDGYTVVFVQDVLVHSAYRRRGIGRALVNELIKTYVHVRQILLISDDTPENRAFYTSIGFKRLSETGCAGYIRM